MSVAARFIMRSAGQRSCANLIFIASHSFRSYSALCRRPPLPSIAVCQWSFRIRSSHPDHRLIRLAAVSFSTDIDRKQKPTVSDNESVIVDIISKRPEQHVQKSTTQKVKQAGWDLTYVMLAVAGVGCAAAFAYVIGGELLSSNSPQSIFARSLHMIRADPACQDLFGRSIKGFGEETRRGRRRNPAHLEYEKDNERRMRMLFYLKGPVAQGCAQLEMKLDENGNWDYRYLFVETDETPKKTFVLIDNR